MKKFNLIQLCLTCLVFLSFWPAHAEFIGAVGTNLLFEYESNGRDIEAHQPLAVRAGWRMTLVDLYVEYSQFSQTQGNLSVSVERERQEWLAWVRRAIVPRWKIAPYAALGLGMNTETVTTQLNDELETERGRPEAVYMAAGGFLAKIRENLDLQIETRVGASARYKPNPAIGFAMFLGTSF